MAERTIAKVLSANDSGETGAHQAGILVPRDERLLSFFPRLDPSRYNPRCHLNFLDDSGTFWEFAFIYYNNSLFDGTRNEYRLTRMTKYIRQANLVAGDEITLTRNDEDRYHISHKRKQLTNRAKGGALKLGTGWRIIEI
ncbi:EcoRII N-terminal effector-binding domain-containing protein [Rhizobium leguminosarum]